MTIKKPDLNIWKYTKLDESTIELTGIIPIQVDDLVIPTNADFDGIETVYITAKVMRDAYLNAKKSLTINQTKDGVLTAKDDNWSGVFSKPKSVEIPIRLTLNHFNTSNITNMSNMFEINWMIDLSSLTNWDVSNVTNMSYMFKYNYIKDLTPLAQWNVANVTDMSYMFDNNYINDLLPLTNWKITNVKHRDNMFANNPIKQSNLYFWNYKKLNENTIELTGITTEYADNVDDLVIPTSADFNEIKTVYITAKVMQEIYKHTTKTLTISQTKDGVLTAKDTNWALVFNKTDYNAKLTLNHFDTSRITNMNSMFIWNNINDLTTLANWDVHNVTDMTSMFYDNQITDLTPLANWDVHNVTDMYGMFNGNYINNLTPLTDWDIANVTYMKNMFDDNPTQFENLKEFQQAC